MQGLESNRFEQTLVAGELSEGEAELPDARALKPRYCRELARRVSPQKDRRAYLELRGIIAELKPHIVHTHQAKAGLLARLAAKHEAGPKLVHTYHGHTFQGYWNPIFGRLVRGLERRLGMMSDALIAQSESQREELRQHLGARVADRIRIIKPGVNFDLFEGTRVGTRSSETISIGFVGRLATVKNVPDFLATLKQLQDHHSLSFKAKIIGDGAASLRERLEEQARALGVAEKIEWKGNCKDMAKTYRELDVVVMTSRNEGTPLAAIEALYCGCRFLSYDVGGIRDTVGDLSGVTLVPPRDFKQLAEALVKVVAKGGPCVDLELENLQRELSQRFGSARLTAEIAELYEDITRASPTRS